MQGLLFNIARRWREVQLGMEALNLSITGLTILFGMMVFTGFLVVKQTDLAFKFGETRTVATKVDEVVLVKKVIDGDTLELEDGRRVRYIGIDAPEFEKCYFEESAKVNRDLVEGVSVRLERDISETDEYGRLLRYVWLEDLLLNEDLVAKGFAKSTPIQPDLKYNGRIFEAHRSARERGLGLWSFCE
jgi:micrococcal nuclease